MDLDNPGEQFVLSTVSMRELSDRDKDKTGPGMVSAYECYACLIPSLMLYIVE